MLSVVAVSFVELSQLKIVKKNTFYEVRKWSSEKETVVAAFNGFFVNFFYPEIFGLLWSML